jgi:multimeric flavodoxin WrbA
MMKITIVNGSPRKNGATGKILQAFGKCLEEKGNVEVCYIELAAYRLQACSGCERCYRTGVCHIDDRAEEINRAIGESEGVIIGSPVYVSNVSGILKNYIDRGHIVVEQALKDKYMFAVTTFEIAGGASVTGMLNTMFRYAGGIPAGKYALKLPHNSNPFDQPKVLRQINRKAGKFYMMINRNKRKSLLDRLINYVALHVVIKPFVVRYPNRYQAVLQQWGKINVNVTKKFWW